MFKIGKEETGESRRKKRGGRKIGELENWETGNGERRKVGKKKEEQGRAENREIGKLGNGAGRVWHGQGRRRFSVSGFPSLPGWRNWQTQ